MKNTLHVLVYSVTAALAVAGGACAPEGEEQPALAEPTATAEPAVAEEQAYPEFIPLTSVTLKNGSVVEFYEASPGSIIVSETGPIDNKFSLTDDQLARGAPIELFRAVSGPEAEVPDTLLAANERREHLLRQAKRDSRVSRISQALSNGVRYDSCANARLFASGGTGFGGSQQHRSASGTDTVSDKSFYRFTLCVHGGQSGGTVSMEAHQRRWFSWSKYGYWVTQPGYYRWWSHTDWNYDFDAKSRYWNGSSLLIDTYTNCSPVGYNCWN